MRRQLTTACLVVTCALGLAMTGCKKKDDTSNNTNTNNNGNTNNNPVDSTFLRPKWGPTLSDSALVVIRRLEKFGAPPIETVDPTLARALPGFQDAVNAIVREHNLPVPAMNVDTMGVTIPVTGGTIHGRLYRPRNASANLPLIVYYQGGGFVIANLDTYDASCRGLSDMTGAAVLSVQYRKGPEFKFPTAHNDAFEAYRWALQNGGLMNVDTTRVAVAGESAGGNLACNVSIRARDNGVRMPRYQVLVYPIANNDMNAASVNQYAFAKPLNKAQLSYFNMYYLNNMSESGDPRLKLVAANLNGLPSTLILNAEIDPLRDDGAALETAMRNAGVTVRRVLYSDVTHEFFSAAAVIPTAKQAQTEASNALKSALQ